MKPPRHAIRFPNHPPNQLAQNEAYFILNENNNDIRLRFHDYGELFSRPGLYEQLFYDRLKCVSPTTVARLMEDVLTAFNSSLSELRVLDVGAGNGMVGEVLMERGVSRLVGIDIAPEARDAMLRDRPGVYDEYYVGDLTNLPEQVRQELKAWAFDCMCCVAALGFGDIPADAFVAAFNLVADQGWVAFNIKETFLDAQDETGFSALIKTMIFSQYVDIYHMQRYRHRLSIDGKPLYYYAIVARKLRAYP